MSRSDLVVRLSVWPVITLTVFAFGHPAWGVFLSVVTLLSSWAEIKQYRRQKNTRPLHEDEITSR